MSTKKNDKAKETDVEQKEKTTTASKETPKEKVEETPKVEKAKEKEVSLEKKETVTSNVSETEKEAVLRLRKLQKELKTKDATIKSFKANSVPRADYDKIVAELKVARKEKREALVELDKLTNKTKKK